MWLKTDDRFPEHRKIRRLSDGAYRLHHTAMCACAKDETDDMFARAAARLGATDQLTIEGPIL